MNTCKWDFIALAETRLQGSLAHMCNMPGYKLHIRQRQNGVGGGLCMYINEAYESDVIPCAFKYDCFEHLELIISSHNLPTKIIISNIYRPPHGSISKFLDEFSKYLDYFSELASHTSTFLEMGDFNIYLLSIKSNSHTSQFIDIL